MVGRRFCVLCANINDYPILKLARDDAFELVNESQRSKVSKNRMLLKRITENFKHKLDLIGTGCEENLIERNAGLPDELFGGRYPQIYVLNFN
jgi:hypothetical protein